MHSAVMQTPQKDAPPSARRSSRQHRPRSEHPQAVHSDNDAYLAAPQEGDQTPSKKKRQPRKKSNARKNGVQSDVGEVGDTNGPRHFSHSERVKHTPAKAIKSDAYAGPTFHQSPAPSALPMPSFLSKSVPPHGATSTVSETADGSSDSRQQTGKEMEEKRETTPLDWMFDAARKVRATPNGGSPARLLSPPNRSPAPSPGAVREETDFPFELEGKEEIKSAYSTPFSQRLAATRKHQTVSEGGQTLTDEERKAKTAALKQTLMNPAGSPGQLGPAFSDNNPFNAREAPVNSTPPPPRHASNPATPTYQNGYIPQNNNNNNPNNHYFHYPPTSPSRNFTAQPNNRPPSSSLRNIYDPRGGAPVAPPNTAPNQLMSTARSPPPTVTPQPARPQNFGAIYGTTSRPASEGNQFGHNSKPSLEQGLDDLKKALNMNFLRQA